MPCASHRNGVWNLPRRNAKVASMRVRGTPQGNVQTNMTGRGTDHEEALRLPRRESMSPGGAEAASLRV